MRERIGKLKQKIKNQKGFTLIELMATLAILALIVAIAIPAVGNILNKAETQSADANVALIEDAGEMAYLGGLDNDNDPLTEIPENVTYTAAELVSGGYLNAELNGAEGALEVQRQSNGTFKELTPAVDED